MRMPRSVDDVIQHAAYDPVARRERYLKTRQLKGRNGSVQAIPAPKAGVGSRVVEGGNASSNVHANRTQAIQAASAARQVAQIEGRLGTLKKHLNELLAKQKAEAGSSSDSKSSDSTSSKSGGGTKGDSKPKTAAQKAAAKDALAKAQKERAKDQKATPDKKDETKTAPSLQEQIDKTRAVISDVESKLKAAKDLARNQTASNGR